MRTEDGAQKYGISIIDWRLAIINSIHYCAQIAQNLPTYYKLHIAFVGCRKYYRVVANEE